jgi:hypothetical protein
MLRESEKTFLGHVFGLGRVAENPFARGEDHLRVPRCNLAECACVALCMPTLEKTAVGFASHDVEHLRNECHF